MSRHVAAPAGALLGVLCAAALVAAGEPPLEGTYKLRGRQVEGRLEIERTVSGRLRLVREADSSSVAEDAVRVGRMVYALYRDGAGMSGALEGGARGGKLLGVYRFAPDLSSFEERILRDEEGVLSIARGERIVAPGPGAQRRAREGRSAPAPAATDPRGLVERVQQVLASPEMTRDLAALKERDVDLRLSATSLGPIGLDAALADLSATSRTRLARQDVGAEAALELFRLGGLRNPPPERAGVRAFSALLPRELIPARFGRVHLLLGQGTTPSPRFREHDQVETWVLLAETRSGEMVAIRAEWQTPTPRGEAPE